MYTIIETSKHDKVFYVVLKNNEFLTARHSENGARSACLQDGATSAQIQFKQALGVLK